MRFHVSGRQPLPLAAVRRRRGRGGDPSWQGRGMNRWLYYWKRLTEQLWVTVGLYAALGGILALAAVLFAPFVSPEAALRFGKFEAVEALLTILASSLLAVATFSLGAMVSAYTAVGGAATPRATSLVVTDRRTAEHPGHLHRRLPVRHRRPGRRGGLLLWARRSRDHLFRDAGGHPACWPGPCCAGPTTWAVWRA